MIPTTCGTIAATAIVDARTGLAVFFFDYEKRRGLGHRAKAALQLTHFRFIQAFQFCQQEFQISFEHHCCKCFCLLCSIPGFSAYALLPAAVSATTTAGHAVAAVAVVDLRAGVLVPRCLLGRLQIGAQGSKATLELAHFRFLKGLQLRIELF